MGHRVFIMIRGIGMCLSMLVVLRSVRAKMSVLMMIVLIKGMVHGVFMEVNWLDIMLIIKSVIKRVVVLMDYVFTQLMLMANLVIMISIIVVGIMMGIIVIGITIGIIMVGITMGIVVVKVSIKTETFMVHWCLLIVLLRIIILIRFRLK